MLCGLPSGNCLKRLAVRVPILELPNLKQIIQRSLQEWTNPWITNLRTNNPRTSSPRMINPRMNRFIWNLWLVFPDTIGRIYPLHSMARRLVDENARGGKISCDIVPLISINLSPPQTKHTAAPPRDTRQSCGLNRRTSWLCRWIMQLPGIGTSFVGLIGVFPGLKQELWARGGG